jgi:hypothetical protein
MEKLEKLLTLLRGELVLSRKDQAEKHAELLEKLSEKEEPEESSKPVVDAITQLSEAIKKMPPPIVKVPDPIVNVEIPEIIVPDITIPEIVIPPINVPETKVTVEIPPIKVPTPQVHVQPPEVVVNMPEEMEVKGLKGWMAKVISVLEGLKNYSIFDEVSFDKPVPTILVDSKGRPYSAAQMFTAPIGSQSSGSGTGGVVTDQVFSVAMAYTVGGDLEYVGQADPGTSQASALWRIKKLVYSSGNVAQVLLADGNDSFDNVWNDRASLSYS